jgi:hypothetical protein
MKKCKKCNEEKPLDEFYSKNTWCKFCHKEYSKEYQEKNKEKRKEYQEKNKEKRKDRRKKYLLENKYIINEKKKAYQKKRRQENLLFRLTTNTRALIGIVIRNKGYKKTSRTHEILGCDFETFKRHIERQFKKGMTWDNQGEWHLDHIYPVSLARDEKHLIELNHYTNFQPMWAADNLSKSNRIIEHQRKLAL